MAALLLLILGNSGRLNFLSRFDKGGRRGHARIYFYLLSRVEAASSLIQDGVRRVFI